MGATVRQAIVDAARRLQDISGTPRLDAELLMAQALGTSRDAMILARLGEAAPQVFMALVERRLRHEPVAYITGTRAFWTLELMVTPDVLIPRPDSETLIEAAVAQLGASPAPRFLDLGTGSGALLLAALDHWPDAWGVGVDRSAGAARVAKGNAERLGMRHRAAFVIGDWDAPISGRFDGIFCNPPYIGEAEALPRDVADHEPASALFAGPDGLDDYRRIIPRLPVLLSESGRAFVETGADQAGAVCELGQRYGLHAFVRQDLAGHDRCVILSG